MQSNPLDNIQPSNELRILKDYSEILQIKLTIFKHLQRNQTKKLKKNFFGARRDISDLQRSSEIPEGSSGILRIE